MNETVQQSGETFNQWNTYSWEIHPMKQLGDLSRGINNWEI